MDDLSQTLLIMLRDPVVYDGVRRRRGEVLALPEQVAEFLIESKRARLIDTPTNL